jgi:hypothetical protein
MESNDTILWVGTCPGGISRYDITTSGWTHYTSSNSAMTSNYVNSIYIDSNNIKWCDQLVRFN